MLLRTVDLDALASSAISSSRLVHCPSDNITEKITRITRSSARVKMLKDAFGNSRPLCRIDAHLLRDTRTHLMASQGPGLAKPRIPTSRGFLCRLTTVSKRLGSPYRSGHSHPTGSR